MLKRAVRWVGLLAAMASLLAVAGDAVAQPVDAADGGADDGGADAADSIGADGGVNAAQTEDFNQDGGGDGGVSDSGGGADAAASVNAGDVPDLSAGPEAAPPAKPASDAAGKRAPNAQSEPASAKGSSSPPPQDCRTTVACAEDGECHWNPRRQECDDGTRPRSRGAMIAGIVLLPSAAIAGAFGAFLVAAAEDSYGCASLEGMCVGGGIAVAGGGAMLITGIVLLAYGAPSVPNEDRVGYGMPLVPWVQLGPTGGSLTWRW